MSRRLRYISLFSGGMGLDLGLEQAGLKPAVCVEFDKHCCATIRKNRPRLPLIDRDIQDVPTREIREAGKLDVGEAFAVVGGPPCQSFSTGGIRRSLQDKRGSLIGDYLRIIKEAKPLYFVFENVAQIVTAALQHRPIAKRPGKRWHLSSYSNGKQNGRLFGDEPLTKDEQAGSAIRVILDEFGKLGYSLTFGILNAADYGVPQRRMRFVAIGSRIQAAVYLPKPTHSETGEHGLPLWRTLRDAIGDFQEENPIHSNYSDEFKRIFDRVPPGANWRSLPPKLQRQALGEKAYVAGGGKTGFFRRLAWDEPSPTIVGKPNRKSCAICHPEHTRPLTVREVARVQGFPDDWQFVGSMHPQYLQVGNAVPVGLGYAIGSTLRELYADCPKRKHAATTFARFIEWQDLREQMLMTAQATLRAAARNKLGKAKAQSAIERQRRLVRFG